MLFLELVVGGLLDRGGQRAAHGRSHRLNGQGRTLGNLFGQFQGCVANLTLLGQHIAHPPGISFFTADPPPGVEHQVGALLADQVRQRIGESKTGMKAEFGKIRRKARLWTHHPEVGHQRQPKAAADGRALDGADNRFFAGKQPHGLGVQRVAALDIAEVPLGLAGMKIRARTEVLALGGQDAGAAVVLGIQGLKRVGQRPDEAGIKKVIGGALDLHRCNVVGQAHLNVSIACVHITLLWGRSCACLA